jgi:MFS family permease
VRGSFDALRERQFRLLFTGQIVSLLGDAITGVALAFAVLDLTGSATDLGYVFAAKAVPLVAFLLVGGVFADRLPRRAVMLTADVARGAAQGMVALLVLTHNAHIWQIVVLQAISGTATAFFNPASTGLTPMTVSPERLQQANALRGLSMASTGIAGSVISGALVAGLGAGWALAIDAATFGVSAFFLAQLRLPAHVMLPAQSFLGDLREGWHEFSSRTWVWVIVLAASVGNMMTSFFAVLGALLSKTSLGGPGAWAAILAALGLGQVVGGFVSLRVHVRRPLFFGSSLLGFLAVPTALLALRAPVALVAAGALLAGVGNMIFNALWETALQQHIPPAALSRVSAYDWFGSLAFQPVGLVIAGPLAAGIGVSATLWIAAGGSLLIALLTVATPSVRQLEAPSLEAPSLEAPSLEAPTRTS